MTKEKELGQPGNSDPIEAQGNNQIVYMVPNKGSEDDEIDFFQLLLPLLKYKVQILLFLIIGILFGIGILWYKITIESVVESEKKHKSYQSVVANLQEKKRFMIEDFNSSINRIKSGSSILQIDGAQYRFSNKNNPEEVKTIDIDSYQSIGNKIEKDTLNQNPSDSEKDFEIILRIKRVNIDLLKQELKEAYTNYFVLNENLEGLEFHKKSNLTKTYVLIEEKQNYSPNSQQKSEVLNKKIEELRKNLLKIEDKKQETTFYIKSLNHKINFIHQTLSDDIKFETSQTEIPLKIWNDIKAQAVDGAKEQQEDILKIAFEIEVLEKEITKFKLMAYIFENNLKIPLDAFDWPALKAFGETETGSAKVYPIMEIGKKKILIISFILSLFIGILSVYIRVFFKRAGDKEEFKSQKQEFTDAIKRWKL